MKYVNTDSQRRAWLTLTDPDTGCTLELDPGKTVDLDFEPDVEFDDPYLRPVGKSVARKQRDEAQKEPREEAHETGEEK